MAWDFTTKSGGIWSGALARQAEAGLIGAVVRKTVILQGTLEEECS
jgi:hypothetical protein